LELVGTIAGEGDEIGVFFDQASRTVLRLRMGEGYDGWVLHELL
jgi:general secretion pathway protein N